MGNGYKVQQKPLRGRTKLQGSVQFLVAVRSLFWLTSPHLKLLVASQRLLEALRITLWAAISQGTNPDKTSVRCIQNSE